MVEKNDKDLLEFRERIAKIKSGVEVEPKPEPEPDEGDSVEEKEQLIKMLEEKADANGKKSLTFSDISDCMGEKDLGKDQMDDIYDTLISKGIEIYSEEPDDTELMKLDEEEVDDPEVDAVIS